MKSTKYALGAMAISLFFITSCSDDNENSTAITYEIPTTYSFMRSGMNSVEFEGQTTRLEMLNEMGNSYTTAATNGTLLDANKLSNMYSNTNNPFSTNALNASGKNIKNKTAASTDYFNSFLGGGSTVEKAAIQAMFENQFVLGAEASQGTTANST